MQSFIYKTTTTLLFLLIWQGNVLAGDFANRHIHGFSVDGQLFAFEEYGVQDGSGFPYSNIYVINTSTDKWVAGSPFRVRLDDEAKSVYEAREEARILAGPVMKSFEDRGNLVASNQPTEKGFDKKRMIANPRIVVPPIDDDIEFRIKTLTFPPSPTCEPFGPSIGFELLRIATDEGRYTKTIHSDKSIPKSRNCPLDYEFADLVTFFPSEGKPKAAILILMKTVGFEGPDGRYLAITTELE
ncbi:MAG: DUF2259 domain-containing protein [Pseudomonadota bacterium]